MSGRAKILIGAAVLLAVLIAAVMVHHHRVKGAAARYRAELFRLGEPLTWKEVIPPPLKADENSASRFMSLVGQLPQTGVLASNYPITTEMVVPGKAMAGWAMPWVGAPVFKDCSNSWEEALADYHTQAGELCEFHALTKHPDMDFRLDYSQTANLTIMHLAQLKQAAGRLCCGSACELRQGQPSAALSHLRAALALARERPQEPLLITELVRIAIAAIAGNATWDYLQAPGLNEEDLEGLQQDWSQLEFFGPMERAFLGERCFMLGTLAEMHESSAGFARLTQGAALPFGGGAGGTPPNGLFEKGLSLAKEGWDRTKFSVAEGAWRVSWSHTDELRMLKGQQALTEVARTAAADGHASNALRLVAEFEQSGLIPGSSGESVWLGGASFAALQTMFSDSVAGTDKAFTKALLGEVNARLATTAIALERYHLRYGHYPPDLNALVPDLLQGVPRDPADGAPLRYRPTSENGYLLYSVGEDLVDDGGNPLKPEAKGAGGNLWWGLGRDWVWAQPAAPSEVEAWWRDELERNFNKLSADDESPSMPSALRAQTITNLAREWTGQCFQALTNTSARTTRAEP